MAPATEASALVSTTLSKVHDFLDLRFGEWRETAPALELAFQESAKGQAADVIERARLELFGSGPIEPLMCDETVSEVLLNGYDEIWCERNGRIQKCETGFSTPQTYEMFVRRICQVVGSELSLDHPFLDGNWQGLRVHISGPPVVSQVTVTLRRPSQSPWTLSRFLEAGWASHHQVNQLKKLVIDRQNVLVVGATGSGKTSALAALLREVDPTERLLVLEDTAEIPLPNSLSCRLLTRYDHQGVLSSVTLQDLVKQSLRMRPDRLVLGEIRGPEAKDLLMAFATGHQGCWGTLHAASAQEALLRLEMLVQLGAPQWSLSAIRRLVFLAIRNVVVVERDSTGKRKLNGIYRLSSVEDFGYLVDRVED